MYLEKLLMGGVHIKAVRMGLSCWGKAQVWLVTRMKALFQTCEPPWRMPGLQNWTSSCIIYTSAVLPVASEGPRMKGVKSLPLEKKKKSLHFWFFKRLGNFITLCFTQDFDLTFHAFMSKCCKWNHSHVHYVLLFLPFYSWSTQRGTCEVLGWSHWHPVWFYHMCLRWNLWFFLYIYVYKLLIWSFFSCVHILAGKDWYKNDNRIILISIAVEMIGAHVHDYFWLDRWLCLRNNYISVSLGNYSDSAVHVLNLIW